MSGENPDELYTRQVYLFEKLKQTSNSLILVVVGLKFFSYNLSPTFTSILVAQFNSPLSNFILRNKLDHKATVISYEENQSLSKTKMYYII